MLWSSGYLPLSLTMPTFSFTGIALNMHSYAITTRRCMAALFREVVFEEADEDNDDNHGNHGINDNPGAMTKWQLMYVRKNPETVIHSAL